MLLKFQGEGHVIISRLEIRYVSWLSRIYPKLFLSEIRKRIFLKRGGRFPPMRSDGSYEAADAEFLKRQQEQIINLYSQQGLSGTQVQIEPNYHGPNGKQVRVKVSIFEGSQPELGPVLLKGVRSFPYSWVVEPITTGERFDFLHDVFGLFGVRRYDRRRLKEELKIVEERYRVQGYYSARVRLKLPDYAPEGFVKGTRRAHPLVQIYEGPQISLEFSGNEIISDEELLKLVSFREAGAVDSTEIENSRRAILEAYQARGYYRCSVELPEAKNGKLGLIHFKIVEGEQHYVRQIRFRGNRHISSAKLLEIMETRGIGEDGVVGAIEASSGILQDARLSNDLIRIRDLYLEQGFSGLRFRCRGSGPKPKRDGHTFDIWSADPGRVRCFQVKDALSTAFLDVEIELDEGLQTQVDRVDIQLFLGGMDEATQEEADELLTELGFLDPLGRWIKGAGLSYSKLETLRGFLLRYYHKEGYLQAQVYPVCLGREGGIPPDHPELDCRDELLYGLHLERVGFQVDHRSLTRVGGILLRGQLQTQEEIIRRELLLKEGAPLGSEALFLSQANLRSLGIFEGVSIESIAGREGFGQASVVVTVEEGDARPLDAFLGLQIDSAALGTDLPVLYATGFTIRDRNLLGRALELGLGGNHANRLDSPSDIFGDDTLFEIGPFFKDRRFFATRLDFALESTFKAALTSQRDRYARIFSTKGTISYDFFNLSYPSPWGRGLRASLQAEFRRDSRRQLSQLGELPSFADPSYSLGFEPSLSWDRRDSPLHPTRGLFATLSGELVFTGVGTATLESPSWKESFSFQYIHSLFKRRLILVPMLRLGAIQTDLEEEELKSSFLFKAGGDGVALPVRGYEDASIDACGGVEDEGNCAAVFDEDDDEKRFPRTIGGEALLLSSLELRFPSFIFDDLWWALFGDLGSVALDWRSLLNADRLYPSLGFGLRWLVTGQIPLRLDLGYPLRETVFSPQEARIHLNLFYTL